MLNFVNYKSLQNKKKESFSTQKIESCSFFLEIMLQIKSKFLKTKVEIKSEIVSKNTTFICIDITELRTKFPYVYTIIY